MSHNRSTSFNAMTKLRLKQTTTETIECQNAIPKHGVLTEWNDQRGFGFITPDDGGQKVFLHVKSLAASARRPVLGDLFFYKLSKDDRGRPRAEEAYQTAFDEKRCLTFRHSVLKGLAYCWPLAVIPAFALTAITRKFWIGLCAAFALNSILVILFYWEDKHLAQYKYWRIPENRLHTWEFLCGWPGALYAQQAFRHKRKKISFMAWFYLCTIANIIGLALLFRYVAIGAMEEAIGNLWNEFISAL